MSKQTAAILSAMVFAATLLGRPVGAVLHGYATLGLAAVVLLIVLRFVDGICLGGAYTSATPLALEHAPKSRRGLCGALIMTGYPLAYCSVALITPRVRRSGPASGAGAGSRPSRTRSR